MRCCECDNRPATYGETCGYCAVLLHIGSVVVGGGGVIVLCYTGLLFGLWA